MNLAERRALEKVTLPAEKPFAPGRPVVHVDGEEVVLTWSTPLHSTRAGPIQCTQPPHPTT